MTSDVLLCKGLSCDDSNTSPDDRTRTHNTPGGSAPDKHVVTADRTTTTMKKKKIRKQPRSGVAIDYLADDGIMDAEDCSCFPSGARK